MSVPYRPAGGTIIAKTTVKFTEDDVALLYTIPKPGGDLATIIQTYCFVNRDAPPTFSRLADCFTKALKAGILLENGGCYRIAPDWYGRIHSYDESESNEIQAMLAFEDEFVGKEVPVVVDTQADLIEDDYETLVRDYHREWGERYRQ